MKILIVEDDLGVSELITGKLEEIGYSFSQAYTASDAKLQLMKGNFDLMILDYSLPDSNAEEFVSSTYCLMSTIPPFIVATGMGDEKIAVSMMKLGARDYIVKDKDFIDFLPQIIKRVIREVDNEKQRVEAERKLKLTNHKLKELNAMKDKFLSIIAHDLKGPLGSFKDSTKLLFEDYASLDEKDRLDILEAMNNSINITYSLLENLLDWSRSQRGKIPFNPSKIEIRQLISKTITILSQIAENKKIRVLNNISQNIFIKADLNMLFTIVRNLISNALKFTNSGGEINISVSTNENGSKIISVSDNGIGMDEETREKLFKIDSQINKLGTNQEKGTGLGLILCKEFVEKHHGEIRVESKLGKGTTFELYFPNN